MYNLGLKFHTLLLDPGGDVLGNDIFLVVFGLG